MSNYESPEVVKEMEWMIPEVSEVSKPEQKEYTRAIVLNSLGEVLVVQRKTGSSFEGGKWELPGGKLEDGELHDAALLRELYEETGLVGELVEQQPTVDERLMQAGNNAHGGKVAHTETKVVLVDNIDIDLTKLQTENMDARWYTKSDIEKLYENGSLSKTTLDTITRILLQ